MPLKIYELKPTEAKEKTYTTAIFNTFLQRSKECGVTMKAATFVLRIKRGYNEMY
jgi:hypothetical protein